MILFFYIFYKDIESNCYSSDGKTLIQVTDPSPHLRISASCEVINDSCFRFLNSLATFTFADSPNLTTIAKLSFSECVNLTIINLTMCSKLKIIEACAFYGCEKVSQILLPD